VKREKRLWAAEHKTGRVGLGERGRGQLYSERGGRTDPIKASGSKAG